MFSYITLFYGIRILSEDLIACIHNDIAIAKSRMEHLIKSEE